MHYKKVLEMQSEELIEWMLKEFAIEIPQAILTIEDMEEAGKILIKLTNYYSYLCALLSFAKINARAKKREKEKEAYEDAIDKREIIQNFTDCIKQKYPAVSRAVTIHIDRAQKNLQTL